MLNEISSFVALKLDLLVLTAHSRTDFYGFVDRLMDVMLASVLSKKCRAEMLLFTRVWVLLECVLTIRINLERGKCFLVCFILETVSRETIFQSTNPGLFLKMY